MQRSTFMFAAAMVAAIFFSSAAARAQTVSTAVFVHNASVMSAFEIAAAKEALKRYEGGNVSIKQNIEVKHFAERMMNDHTAIAQKLDGALTASTIGLTAEHIVDSRHQPKLDVLKSISKRTAFDEQYANIMKEEHEKDVQMFREYAQYGDDEQLKAFATEVLPVLEDHLKHVRDDLKPTQ